jgi:hypothetical protein
MIDEKVLSSFETYIIDRCLENKGQFEVSDLNYLAAIFAANNNNPDRLDRTTMKELVETLKAKGMLEIEKTSKGPYASYRFRLKPINDEVDEAADMEPESVQQLLFQYKEMKRFIDSLDRVSDLPLGNILLQQYVRKVPCITDTDYLHILSYNQRYVSRKG